MQRSQSATVINAVPVNAYRVQSTFYDAHLTQYFGRDAALFEQALNVHMQRLAPGHVSGFFDCMALSNGGCYLSLWVGKLDIELKTAYGSPFSGSLSADTVSILATLFAYIELSEHNDRFVDHYYKLSEYIDFHDDATLLNIILYS